MPWPTCGLLLAVVPQTGAFAATQIEHGSYLVNTIMACGNCHSPRDAQGKLIPDKALSGGLKFTPPVFVATASNITPDPETGIGTWTDDEIKRALTEGAPQSWPAGRNATGRGDAGKFL